MSEPFSELLSRAIAGETSATDTLYVMSLEHLSRAGKIQLSHPLKTIFSQSDAAQEVLVLVLRKLQTFKGSTEAEWYKWLDAIAGNVVKDQNRMVHAQKRDIRRAGPIADPPVGSDLSTPSHAVTRADSFYWVQKRLEQLPREQQMAMKMRYLEEASISEIAIQMSKSEDAVAGLLRRGLATTREWTKSTQADHK